MSTIDVFWVSPDENWITRGYQDCAFLEALLRNELWRPQEAFTFVNHDVRGDFPHHDGAVVCFNGMGLAPHADWIIDQIERMPWSLVIITGNEMWDFPWERLPEAEHRKVWVMNPTPAHAHLSNRLPGGWYTGTREGLEGLQHLAATRHLDWFYGAQIINDRRRQCLAAVEGIPGGDMILTDRFMGGAPYPEWLRRLASAKVIPCPSGPMTLDANRPLAALEAGCVPVLDLIKPLDPQFDYWALCFGDDYPMPVVMDWGLEFRPAMDKAIRRWPEQSNRMFSWWQGWKRDTACKLHDHIRQVSGLTGERTTDDRVTAIITTSPIPDHPDTWVVDETIRSIRERLPHADIIVAFDGVRPEQQHQRADYDEYIRRVLWNCNWHWRNVLPLVLDEWGHQANATRAALTKVRTDNILFMEHDTPLVGDIPTADLLDRIDNGAANVIRLHPDVSIHEDHQRIMLDRHAQNVDGVPLRRTSAWWARPHFAASDFYREILTKFFPPESRTMIEDRLYPIMYVDCIDRRGGWKNWLVWIYEPPGDIRRSGHLDGRKDQDKFEMFYGDNP